MATTTRREKDACDLLDDDHKKVKKMFKEYESLAESKAKSATAKKQQLAQQICDELKVHTTLEEEIFYPAVRAAIKDDDLLNEAEVEHTTVRDLIKTIEGMSAGKKRNAHFTVLVEYVKHHVKEERNEMFPKARSARRLDLVALREQMEARKAELVGEPAEA